MSIPGLLLSCVQSAVTDVLTASTLRNQAGNVPPVNVRKFPLGSVADSDLYYLITLGQEESEPATGADDFAYFVKYPVTVTMIRSTATGVTVEADLLRDVRNTIRSKLLDFMRLTLPTGLPLDDADYMPTPRYMKPALQKGFDFSQLTIVFKTREGR